MGNAIRLGIARLGLSLNSFWTATRTRKAEGGRKLPIVLLLLGAEKVGKSTITSRILEGGKRDAGETTYVPTKGFSIFELKDRATSVKFYDLGGSPAVRELWTHYYPDAHGIIYVVDTSGRSGSVSEQSEILKEVLRDERVKRKPLLLLGNKQDLGMMYVEDFVNQMDLIKTVNTAKCVTRVDLTSCYKIDGFEDGLMTGFRWLVSYVKWQWLELNERVSNDSLLERSVENARFEASRFKSAPPSPSLAIEAALIKAVVELPAPSPYTMASLGSSVPIPDEPTILPNAEVSAPAVLMILPQRLDPEGGNEEKKEWKLDAAHQMTHQPDTEDEDPEVVMVESRAEVHTNRSRSASAACSINSTTNLSRSTVFSAESSRLSINGSATRYAEEVDETSKPKTEARRPKLFRNKTAPIADQPIRIPITSSNSTDAGESVRAISTTRV